MFLFSPLMKMGVVCSKHTQRLQKNAKVMGHPEVIHQLLKGHLLFNLHHLLSAALPPIVMSLTNQGMHLGLKSIPLMWKCMNLFFGATYSRSGYMFQEAHEFKISSQSNKLLCLNHLECILHQYSAKCSCLHHMYMI